MKFLFIIQGEGRGHMTQAIALSQILKKAGHELCSVCIGKSNRRQIPDFVQKKLHVPIHTFESPNFVTDKNHKAVRPLPTITQNLGKWRIFQKSLKEIDGFVKTHKPDIILNFYDILAGIYNWLYKPECEFWSIGHQYLAEHRDFAFPKNSTIKQVLFKINNHLTALHASNILALSFRPMDKFGHKTKILPPLLRSEIKSLEIAKDDFIMAYMVNPGYGDELMLQAKENPTIKIEVFWDKKGAPSPFQPLPNLTFHKIDDQLFLSKMATCKGLITTAGFESVCEAMYLGKKVMMIPVKGQFEQACNALDALQAHAGIISDKFDIIRFDDYLNQMEIQGEARTLWADSFEKLFKEIINDTVSQRTDQDYFSNPYNQNQAATSI